MEKREGQGGVVHVAGTDMQTTGATEQDAEDRKS